MRIKGETIVELGKLQVPWITVLKPGLIKDRKDARFVENLFKWVPFFPKIKAEQLGQFSQLYTEEVIQKALNKETKGMETIDNEHILKKLEEMKNHK